MTLLFSYKANIVSPKYYTANSYLVEMVLLGFTFFLDTVWPYYLTTRWQKCNIGDTRKWKHGTEEIPETKLWFWVWLPSSCCCCSCRLGSPLLVRFCLWHQISEFPKKIGSAKSYQLGYSVSFLSIGIVVNGVIASV